MSLHLFCFLLNEQKRVKVSFTKVRQRGIYFSDFLSMQLRKCSAIATSLHKHTVSLKYCNNLQWGHVPLLSNAPCAIFKLESVYTWCCHASWVIQSQVDSSVCLFTPGIMNASAHVSCVTTSYFPDLHINKHVNHFCLQRPNTLLFLTGRRFITLYPALKPLPFKMSKILCHHRAAAAY